MAMNAEMVRLEKTLDAHVRRRIIMNKELQQVRDLSQFDDHRDTMFSLVVDGIPATSI